MGELLLPLLFHCFLLHRQKRRVSVRRYPSKSVSQVHCGSSPSQRHLKRGYTALYGPHSLEYGALLGRAWGVFWGGGWEAVTPGCVFVHRKARPLQTLQLPVQIVSEPLTEATLPASCLFFSLDQQERVAINKHLRPRSHDQCHLTVGRLDTGK